MELWLKILIWAVPVIFAVTVHEVAHGWVANYLGDDTAKRMGRLSLNPIRHIDPVGTILVPGLLMAFTSFIFGWAKPVPVNARGLNKPKRDMGIVAIAGPASNLVMSVAWAFVTKLGLSMLASSPKLGSTMVFMGVVGVWINAAMMMLNLLPVPPLDGGRIMVSLLPLKQAYWFQKLERWGLVIVVGLMVSGLASKILWPLIVAGITVATYLTAIPVEVFNNALLTLINS